VRGSCTARVWATVQPLWVTNPLRVIDAARGVVDGINQLLDTSKRPLLYDVQLRASAGSIAANIREAYGRRAGAERNQFLRDARGSAEETDEHLRANFRRTRLPPARYWRLHNRLAVIVKMLNSMLSD
jgi:four helix bundle protein